jgi:hypothetical protein
VCYSARKMDPDKRQKTTGGTEGSRFDAAHPR